MTAEDVQMQDASEQEQVPEEELAPFPTISILQLIKDAQAQHGLRHGDYNRYRTYCTDRLKRMRQSVKFVNIHKCSKKHKSKFVKRWITDEVFADEKFLHLQLFETERRWAKAMHDKTFLENDQNPRKRMSMKMNLKKAVYNATVLDSLVKNSSRCDAITKLEAQAYSLYLLGCLSFELKLWNNATESFKAAKTVYEKLADATHDTTLVNLYKARCREIQPQLRLCQFNNEETGAVANISELMNIRMQIGDSDHLDKLLNEMRSKSSGEIVEITWGGDKVGVMEEKAREVVLGWRQAQSELEQCDEPKQKMALYEKQLADTRDALDRMSDVIRRKTADNADIEPLQITRAYLDFLRLSRTAERYLAMIENTKLEKKYKPQDLLRLYDSVIEILKEVKELNGAAVDKELMVAYSARIEYYRAFRCHYMAAAYAYLSKYAEACALYNLAAQRICDASALVQKVDKKNPYFTETKKALDELLEQNKKELASTKTQRMTSVMEVDQKKAALLDSRPLIEALDDWNGVGKVEEAILVRMPPPLVPMPNKPMFFDLALNHVTMPDVTVRLAELEAKKKKTAQPQKQAPQKKKKGAQAGKEAEPAPNAEQPEGGLSGMVKGWFWGKK